MPSGVRRSVGGRQARWLLDRLDRRRGPGGCEDAGGHVRLDGRLPCGLSELGAGREHTQRALRALRTIDRVLVPQEPNDWGNTVGQGQGSIEGEDASAMDFYSADGEANGLWNDMHVHGDVVVGENLAHDESCFGCDRVFGMNVLCQTTRGAGVARPIIG